MQKTEAEQVNDARLDALTEAAERLHDLAAGLGVAIGEIEQAQAELVVADFDPDDEDLHLNDTQEDIEDAIHQAEQSLDGAYDSIDDARNELYDIANDLERKLKE